MKFKRKVKFNFAAKNILTLSLIVFVSSMLLCTMSYFYLRQIIHSHYGNNLYNIATSVAKLIDKDKIIKYRDTLEMDDEYNETVKKLDIIKSSMNLKFLYVDSWDERGKRFVIYDATNAGDGIKDSAYDRQLLGDDEPPNEEASKIISNSDSYEKYHEDSSKKYGHNLSSYYPIKDNGKNIALVGADMSLSKILREINKLFLIITIFIFFSISLLSFFILLFFEKKFVSPVQKISDAANNFINLKNDEMNVEPLKLNVVPESDIGILQKSFNKMIKDIPMYVEHIKKITTEKEQITAELNIATKIQTSLIPHIFPAFPELNEIDIYATMKPARKVGGDFYDFFLLDDNRLAFVIADVSGKGIGAALFMVITKTLIKNNAFKFNTPSDIINHVNKQLCSNNDSGMFITAFFGILDLKTGQVNYTNAGHINPILKFGRSDFEELNLNKQFVMAGMPNLNFKTENFQMNKGDVIFLYTDGISEATDKHSQYFGKKNLLECLNSIDLQNNNLKDVSDFINAKIKEFEKGKEQTDDITMLILKYNGKD